MVTTDNMNDKIVSEDIYLFNMLNFKMMVNIFKWNVEYLESEWSVLKKTRGRSELECRLESLAGSHNWTCDTELSKE